MASSRAPFVAVRTDIRKEERVRFIADRAGYNEYEAIGRLTSLWCWCTDRGLDDAPDDCPGYAVPDAVIRRFLGPAGVEAILGDGCDALAMGERRSIDGLIYLHGTDDTVARLRSLRASSVAGGRGRAAKARREGGRFARDSVVQTTHDQPSATSPDPAIASEIPDPRSQIPDPEDQDPPPARARAIAGAGPEPAPAAAAPLPLGLERRQVLRAQIWASLAAARARVAAKLGIAYRMLLAQDPGERELATVLATAGEQLEETAATAMHVVAIAEAEAIRDTSMQWLTGVIFEPRNFRRLAAMSLEDARRARPTKPGAPAEPPRKPPRRADPPPAVVSDEERAAAAEVLAEARAKLFGGSR